MNKFILILVVSTDSDSDTVDFALIPYTIRAIRLLNKGIKTLKTSNFFSAGGIVFNNFYIEFYTDIFQLPQEVLHAYFETTSSSNTFVINLTEDQVNSLSKPSENINGSETIFRPKTVTFFSIGEQSRKKYWAKMSWPIITKRVPPSKKESLHERRTKLKA